MGGVMLAHAPKLGIEESFNIHAIGLVEGRGGFKDWGKPDQKPQHVLSPMMWLWLIISCCLQRLCTTAVLGLLRVRKLHGEYTGHGRHGRRSARSRHRCRLGNDVR